MIQKSPYFLIQHWPRHLPLAVLCSNSQNHDALRITLTSPNTNRQLDHVASETQNTTNNRSKCKHKNAALHFLDQELTRPDPPLFWVLALAYDLAPHLEPAVGHFRTPDWPLIELHPCSWSMTHDAAADSWSVAGDAEAAAAVLRELESSPAQYVLDQPDPEPNRESYLRATARALELIRAGDIYQVNLAHRLSSTLHGSPRSLAADLFRSALPWHGCYLETPGRAILSASPELFLQRVGQRLTTRPMKGTRPINADERELFDAEKDRAELNMIVDLMRNDLGRVCSIGSIRVENARQLERHAQSVLQATATISGLLRPGTTFSEILAATFPPGSVTGAPKIRAMQIIEELETHTRGPYCGSIGVIQPNGDFCLNVAIRTALLTSTHASRNCDEWNVDYHVGAGIVADSIPQNEWAETLDKAHVLCRLANSERAQA